MQGIYLKQNVGVFSTTNSQLIGLAQGSGEGIVLRPGKYGRLLSFGNIWGFTKFGIKIQVGRAGPGQGQLVGQIVLQAHP